MIACRVELSYRVNASANGVNASLIGLMQLKVPDYMYNMLLDFIQVHESHVLIHGINLIRLTSRTAKCPGCVY